MGLPLDGASTLGGGTALTCVGVMGHDVPGMDEAGSSQQGRPLKATGSDDPHLSATHVSLPTASGDPHPDPTKGRDYLHATNLQQHHETRVGATGVWFLYEAKREKSYSQGLAFQGKQFISLKPPAQGEIRKQGLQTPSGIDASAENLASSSERACGT